MAKTILVIFGALVGLPMTFLHLWAICGAIFGEQLPPSSPEFANTPYDEGGGFAAGDPWPDTEIEIIETVESDHSIAA